MTWLLWLWPDSKPVVSSQPGAPTNCRWEALKVCVRVVQCRIVFAYAMQNADAGDGIKTTRETVTGNNPMSSNAAKSIGRHGSWDVKEGVEGVMPGLVVGGAGR